MNNGLLSYFWNCGDDSIIQFALQRGHLNKREKEVIHLILDECMSQEEAAEEIGYSVRRTQEFWSSGCNKLLSIPWVRAYAMELRK